ncbi:MAG: Mur ligase family protein [Bacillota bacterium]
MEKIKGISSDSRNVKDGYIFVAINGLKKDGNNYINEAISNGANLIISDKKSIKSNRYDIPVLMVEDAREYLAKIIADFYHNPSHKLKLIGVTGTNGKTTITHLIYNLLNYKKKNTGIIGTIKVDTKKNLHKGILTTPKTEDLQKYLKEMLDNNLKYCAMEVSSHGIKLKRIAYCNFALKIASNITSDHLDLHQNINEYINVKKSFLKDNTDTPVLINQDNKILASFSKLCKNQINYSVDKNTCVKAENIKQNNNQIEYIYSLKKDLNFRNKIIKQKDFKIKMNLYGKHNIYNSLAAITAALYFNLNYKTIQNFFKNYKGIWRRFEIIYKKEFMIIDDCAHNPGSYKAIFSTIKEMKYNNLYVINSIRGNRGIKINKENAQTIADSLKNIKNHHLIITACKDTANKNDIVTKREKNKFIKVLKNNEESFFYYEKLKNAIKFTLKEITKGDILLLLGAHAMDNAGKLTLEILQENKIVI